LKYEKQKVDYSLYLVTDRALSLGRSNLEVIEAAVSVAHIPLIINDRIDIALALDADGVHLGQEDMPVDVARKILGPDKIIGASAFTTEEAVAAESMGADYLGLSPIYVTTTKPELVAEIGLKGIASLKRAVKIPIVGIGSMNPSNAYEAVRAGLDGVAVVSAICSQEDPKAAATAIKAEVIRAKQSF
jgi:thiamine-phosphate pyrophosphorylase